MGFKTFLVNEKLRSADVNALLMRQSVVKCTSTTRPPSPDDGMTVFETDTKRYATFTAGIGWHPMGAHQRIPDKWFHDRVTAGTATSFTEFGTHIDLATAVGPTRMAITLTGYAGFSGSDQVGFLQIRDAANNLIATPHASAGELQWANPGNLFAGVSAQVFLDFANDQSMGFKLFYRVNASTTYIEATTRVEFLPLVA